MTQVIAEVVFIVGADAADVGFSGNHQGQRHSVGPPILADLRDSIEGQRVKQESLQLRVYS